jgi:hypothetical protein
MIRIVCFCIDDDATVVRGTRSSFACAAGLPRRSESGSARRRAACENTQMNASGPQITRAIKRHIVN